MRAYQRARPAIKTVEAARRWEHIYVAGAATSIALLGLWCYSPSRAPPILLRSLSVSR
jgi:hypothetical protein